LLDVKLLRDHPEVIRNDLRKRQWLDKLKLVDEAAAKDLEWRQTKQKVDELRHSQNKLTAEIAGLKKQGKDVSDRLAEVKGIPREISDLEKKAEGLQARVREIMMSLPNILHDSVPVGPDESGNVTIVTWGKPVTFDFAPKDHIDILNQLGLVDMERAAKTR